MRDTAIDWEGSGNSRGIPRRSPLHDRTMRRAALVACCALMLTSPALATPVDVQWQGGSGTWSEASNWTPEITPANDNTNTFNVAIGSGAVALDISPEIQSLVMTGGVISSTSAQTLTVHDSLFVHDATIADSIHLAATALSKLDIGNGSVTFSNGQETQVDSFALLPNGLIGGTKTFTVTGLASWSGGGFKDSGVVNFNGGLQIGAAGNVDLGGKTANLGGIAHMASNGALMTGAAGAMMNILPAGRLYTTGNTVAVPVSNQGELAAGALVPPSQLMAPVNNSGTITGNLRFFGGGASTGLIQTGPNAFMEFAGGDFTSTGEFACQDCTVSGGSLSIGGVQTFIQGANMHVLNSAVLNLQTDAGPNGARLQVHLGAHAKLNLMTTQHLRYIHSSGASLTTLTAGAEPGQHVLSLQFGTLQLSDSSQLDLTNNGLVQDYDDPTNSPLASFRTLITSGFKGGTWKGPGIISTTAGSNGATAVGYAEASTVLGISGSETGSFLGETVDSTAVLVRFTLTGDADLDGTVGFSDLVAVARHYGSSDGTPVWTSGDFNYDGKVDFSDLVAVAQNYGGILAEPPAGGAPGFTDDFRRAFASVPEPGVNLQVIAASFLLTRRRRGRKLQAEQWTRPSPHHLQSLPPRRR